MSAARREPSFRQIVEDSPDLVLVCHLEPTFGFDYLNPAVRRMLGYGPDELIARPNLVFELVHPEDRSDLERIGSLADEAGPTVIRWRRRDGAIVWTELFVVRDESFDDRAIIGFAREVTDRNLVEQQLRGALDREHEMSRKLRNLNELKDLLLRTISHDGRGHLASIAGLTDTLIDRAEHLDAVVREEFLRRVRQAVGVLESMFENLLDLDRIVDGDLRLEPTIVDLAVAARQVSTGVDLGERPLQIQAGPVLASVDLLVVERILANLLANAARHTPEGTRLWVRFEVDDDATIVVEDEGPGVPDDLREHIFRERETASGSARTTGIGLALVSRLAASHGGHAWVEDRPGGGASFHVRLATNLDPASSR